MSWGVETPHKFTEEGLRRALEALDTGRFGSVIRAKGFVDAEDGGAWIHFDYVPGERELRRGPAGVTGRLCVIGSALDEEALKELFAIG